MRRSAMTLACLLFAPGVANTAYARGESCAEDADCASGERCEKGDSAVDCAATPPSSGDGDSDSEAADRIPNAGCGAAPAEPALGSCEPAPIECEEHADCPEGLVCRKRDGDCTASSEGGEPECTTSSEPGRCVYEAEPCDGTCGDDRYDCLAIGGSADCSAQPGAPCPNNGECPPPPEPVCTPEEKQHFCFPARVDCASDADCDGGWSCVALTDDVKDDAPEGWEGADRLCLPEGLALAIEGTVDVGGGSSESSQDTAGNERPTKGGDDNGAPESGQPGGPTQMAASGDGCSVAEPGARAGSALPWLALLGMGLVRRRRSRR